MSVRETVRATVAGSRVSVAKVRRLVGYGAVGATGIAVDLAIVEGAIRLGVHHLLAITIAYQVAMTWNFVLQRQLVYQAGGNPIRQYLRYLVVDVSAFVVRAGVVIATVDLASPWDALPYVPGHIAPAVPASFVGIVLAFLVGFQGTDTVVFGRWVDEGA
jgi:dolichol-phosphate mannosyltransferase